MQVEIKGSLESIVWGTTSGDMSDMTCDLGSGRCMTLSVPNDSVARLKRLTGQPMTLTISVREPDPGEARTYEGGGYAEYEGG